ncbi:hypothetical protein DMX04_10580 [Pseudomonas koreensis]|nr:hypothetical protein DMX04_10580 [Pseudomonas koreensis]
MASGQPASMLNVLPQSLASQLPQGLGGFRNRRKHKGEPKLPFNLSSRALFIIEGRSVVVFGNRGPVQLFGDPHPGSRANVFF